MNEDTTTLTSFNFDLHEDADDNEGVFSKLMTKVKSAVSGQHPTVALHTTEDIYSAHDGTTSSSVHRMSQNSSAVSILRALSHKESTAQGDGSSIASIHESAVNLPETKDLTSSKSAAMPSASAIASRRQALNTTPTPPASYRDLSLVSFPHPPNSSFDSSTKAPPVTTVVQEEGHAQDSLVQSPLPVTSTGQESSQETLAPNDDFIGTPITKSKSVDSDAQSVATTFSISTSHSLSRIIARLRGQKADMEFWMADEKCNECYKCRKPFTLLRRRHHCRICGQIFCGKCASHTVSGKKYKQKGEVRVCNFCYYEHHTGERDHLHTSVPSITMNDTSTSSATEEYSSIIPSQKPPLAAPKMHIPTTAVKQPHSQYGGSDTQTVALEIPAATSHEISHQQPAALGGALSRSGSFAMPVGTVDRANLSDNNATGDGGFKKLLLDASTSLLKPRPRSNTSASLNVEDIRLSNSHHGTTHPFKNNVPTTNSMYLDRGGGTVVAESDLSPFMGRDIEDEEDGVDAEHQLYDIWIRPSNPPTKVSTRIPSSGSNQSQYMIDQTKSESSGPTLMKAAHTSTGSDDEAYDIRLRAKRTEELRGHVGPLEKSLSLRRQSISSNRVPRPVNRQQSIRIVTTNLPKSDYFTPNEAWSPSPFISPFDEKFAMTPLEHSTIKSRLLSPRHRRISAPPPNVELSYGALMHARKMLKQLMLHSSFSSISNKSKAQWEDVIMNLLLKITDNVRPDIHSGDDMDIRHYVKIKKIPGGRPTDSFYVKGVVCSKNVAHKKMIRNILQPRILILLFALDYSRVEMENQLMSINAVIAAEKQHITKLVARIIALRPSLLLVKSTVSRIALELLLEANIPVIQNVKYSVIEAVARCTQASIFSSIDKLQHEGVSFGQCGTFEIRTYMHEWIPNRKKTFLIFDDCLPDLGGTIVLRGAKNDTLRLIKRLIDFMVFVVNNLKLETSLLRDSFAKNRSLDQTEDEDEDEKLSTTRSRLHCQSSTDFSEIIEDTEEMTKENPANRGMSADISLVGSDLSSATAKGKTLDDFLNLFTKTTLSASQFVTFPPPYLLTRLKAVEERLAVLEASRNAPASKMSESPASPTKSSSERHSISSTNDYTHSSHKANPELDAEYEHLVAKRVQLRRACDTYLRESSDYINPFFHQNIAVLYSVVCTETTVPCQGPEIRVFEYYCQPSDMTLGQYIIEFCEDAMQPCSSSMCEHPVKNHYRSYAHEDARINVMIESRPCQQPGMAEKILMWSYCKLCEKPTPVIPMSDNTWSYSFGKFLEICLYQKGVHCRADICPHDIGRHHVRYFGYKDFEVRFQYEPIELLEVTAPPMKLFMLSQVQIDIKEADLKSLRTKIGRFYQSITERNKAFPFDLVDPRKLEVCKSELQEMSQRVVGDKKRALQILQKVYATTEPNDTLTINWVRRVLFQQITQWDLEYADFVRHYLQPERELRKITANHLRKVFPPDLSEETITSMGGERTKIAAEMTDLPLLGTELDDEYPSDGMENDVDISHSPAMFPRLAVSPTELILLDDQDQKLNHEEENVEKKQVDTDDKAPRNSFLSAEVRRRLSLELIREFNAKLDWEESFIETATASDISAPNSARSKSPTASTVTTPSRIPVLHLGRQNRAKLSPPLYEQYSRGFHRTKPHLPLIHPETSGDYSPRRKMSEQNEYTYPDNLLLGRTLDGKPMIYAEPQSLFANKRHGIHDTRQTLKTHQQDEVSTGRRQLVAQRKGQTARDRRFRSRLPRKKTSMQVYTRVNDLVRENMEDEFPGDLDDLPEESSSGQQRETGMTEGKTLDEVPQERSPNVDYFSPMAPFSGALPPVRNASFFSQRYQGVAEAITGFGMELERHPPPAIELLDPPPVSIIEALSSSDIHDQRNDTEETMVPDDIPSMGQSSGLMRDTTMETFEEYKPPPERNLFMKTITSFLTDSGVSNLLPLEYPLLPTEHVFPDSLVVVREDEPSTIIAYTLSCDDYLLKMQSILDSRSEGSGDESVTANASAFSADATLTPDNCHESTGPSGTLSGDIQETLLRETGTHMGYSFKTGNTKFFCKIFFAEQFDALRRNCGCDESYILSLSSCVKWDSSGGKSGSAFLKTRDDRLLMKQVSRFELDAFLSFALAYFHYMSEAFFRELPTVLAKIFGFYTIGYKNPVTGKSMRMDVLVMENLFYQRKVKKIFDLKGSLRNRHVQSTGKQDEVLLDENLVELIYQSPLFIRAHSKEMLRSSLHNDTLFLSSRNVMDYSLLVGIDDERQELVVGIVDFIRTFTWDKKLESWVKESGILGGGGKEPTIVSPRQYRIRFREAMERYFFMVPDHWALTRHNPAPYSVVHHHQTPHSQQDQRPGSQIDYFLDGTTAVSQPPTGEQQS